MVIDISQLETMIASFMLPFCRIGAVLMVMTLFSARAVSQRFRVILAVAITVAIAPALPAMSPIELFSGHTLVIVAQEIAIGVSFGFISRLLLETFVLGAQIIAMQTGLGFASMVDPTNGLQVPVLSQFYLMLVTLLFLALDGHLIMIEMIVHSFHSLPIGGEAGFNLAGMKAIIDWVSYLFAAALMMSLAAALSLLMINISFGVMTRAAPQLNIFAVGFPMTMISGLLVVWFTLSGFEKHFLLQFDRALELMCSHLRLECQ